MIFVFGSNESGIHGAGAAHFAKCKHGAVEGMGFGPAGNSFAIPTKDWRIQTLETDVIQHYVNRFIIYARMQPRLIFQVTAIGCGLAGLTHQVVAPMFKYAPENCAFDTAWADFLPPTPRPKMSRGFWGTF